MMDCNDLPQQEHYNNAPKNREHNDIPAQEGNNPVVQKAQLQPDYYNNPVVEHNLAEQDANILRQPTKR